MKSDSKKYDYIIVGAGFFGSICAYELNKAGKSVVVLEKRDHVGGNCYTEKINEINVHKYGPHIFHTNEKWIWDWINQFADFNGFKYNPIANYKGKLYSLPFSMFTFNQMWGVTTPNEAKQKIDEQRYIGDITNLEEQALSLVGKVITPTMLMPCTSIPSFPLTTFSDWLLSLSRSCTTSL